MISNGKNNFWFIQKYFSAKQLCGSDFDLTLLGLVPFLCTNIISELLGLNNITTLITEWRFLVPGLILGPQLVIGRLLWMVSKRT